MKTLFYRLAYRLIRLYWRVFHPVTYGVRLLLVRDGQVLLVKHVYQDEWFLPGGGVKRGERADQAARREAAEEVGADLHDLALFGLYTSLDEGKTGHVAAFLARDFSLSGRTDAEIEQARFFPLDALPGNVARGCQNRLEAFRSGPGWPAFGDW